MSAFSSSLIVLEKLWCSLPMGIQYMVSYPQAFSL